MDDIDTLDALTMTAEIVAAYVGRNPLPAHELPVLLKSVHAAVLALGNPAPEPAKVEPRIPAVSVKTSITPDALISLIDGKPYKTLKRHIGTHGFTPESYRTAFGLPADYPMVAVNYATKRSALAKSIGLGRARPANSVAA